MFALRGHTDSVQALAYSPDGTMLASAGDDRSVRLWDLASSKTRLVLGGGSASVLTVAFSPDGSLLAYGGFDKRVFLCDPHTGEAVDSAGEFHPFAQAVTGIAFSPDNRRLAAGSDLLRFPLPGTSTLRVRDVREGTTWFPLRQSEPQAVWCVGFSPDSSLLAAGLNRGQVILWDVASRSSRWNLRHNSGVNALAFSPDGKTLAVLAGRHVRLWRLGERWEAGPDVAEHDRRAWTLAFTPNGQYLATGGWDGTVRLWDPRSGQERAKFDWGLGRRVNAIAFAPDGMTAAAAGDSPDIIIWDVDDFSW